MISHLLPISVQVHLVAPVAFPMAPQGPFSFVLIGTLLLSSFAVGLKSGDCVALGQFLDQVHGGRGTAQSSNSMGSDCCKQEGVSCSSRKPYPTIERLLLNSSHLSGAIPSLSSLRNLVYLDLSHNSFSGQIPAGLTSSSKLQHLDLSWNNLSGSIPANMTQNCGGLESLNLEHNDLTGSIPGDLFRCQKLQQLFAAGNSLDRLSSSPLSRDLELLDISSNNFHELDFHLVCRSAKNLTKLRLSDNRLGKHGSVNWTYIGDLISCTKLEELDVSNNGFNGSIPDSIGNLSTKLATLKLRGNNIKGSISDFTRVHKLANLIVLDLGNTSILGSIPSSISNLTNLEKLYLDANSLDEGLSAALGSLNHLSILDISHNNFTGPIPAQVFNSCSSLIYLNLSNNGFDGEIPSFLQKCEHLEVLRLQNNSLSGRIPEFLGSLRALQLLDLSNNRFTGPVPTGGIFDEKSKFLFGGNEGLWGSDQVTGLRPCPSNSSSPPTEKGGSGELPKARLASIIIIIIVLILVFLLIWLFYKHKCFVSKTISVFVKDDAFLRTPLSVTDRDLQAATKGFSSSCLIGSGGVGIVYRGFLEREKKEVAVKILKEQTFGDSRNFMEACYEVRMIRHCNLVKMLTSCLNVEIEGNRFKALIYEFVPHGNLEMWLHKEVVSQAMSFKKWNLNLYQRLNMAIDIASLLSHLHCDFNMPIVHCNLKPSNILITEDMVARVSDFGMNKFFQMDSIVRNSTGYIAPEYSTSTISPKWDVYSFGVILLEMFTGKRPTDGDFRGASSLQKYVLHGYPSNIEEIIDPLLLSEETGGKLTYRARECVISILNIALSCSKDLPENRIDIKVVLERLELTKAAFLDAGNNGDVPYTAYGREGSSKAMLLSRSTYAVL